MRSRPTGTVTFAFTDIEGSTQRWERDRARMERAVRRHDELLRAAIQHHGGYVFKALGDAFCAAFSDPADATEAMLDAQRALAEEDFSDLDGLRVRAAIYTGTADERNGDYFGPALNRVARLLAAAHGGQVLVSGTTAGIVARDLPEEVGLRDLGEIRLRDVPHDERVYQLVAPGLTAEFPPLRAQGGRSNLPLQLTSFVGRARELGEIAALIESARLVTLTGSGGVGKTRAALQVASHAMDAYSDGVWFVDLAPLTSGDFIPSTIAATAGIALPAAGDPTENLVRSLASKSMLLIVDNCEHLIAPVARVVAAVLSGCPNLRVLATSRQDLEIAGERTYRLPPLETTAATALFAERARGADERFALTDENAATVGEICDRLDGVPLAIELAATRTNILSPKQLAEKLDERFRLLKQSGGTRLPRQQTLRALIDWSFDLLDEKERTVFQRLSVFAGGWSLAGASAICADRAIDEWDVFELLSALAAKSLVVVDAAADERRYHLLNSIREYGRERLAEAGETEAIAAKHAIYVAGLVENLAPFVDSLEDERWQRTLAPELDNVRGALDWAIVRRNDLPTGLRLLAHLEWPELLTTPQEAVRWFDAAVELIGETGDRIRARVLRHHVLLEWMVGRATPQREKHAERAVAAARASQDFNETAHALTMLGSVYRDAERFDEAERVFGEAYASAESLSPIALNALLRNWAVTNLQRGDVETARRRFTEVAQRERPGSEAHASALLNIGELEFAVGNVEAARTAARRATETYKRLNTAPLALAVCNLAAYALALDLFDEAAELLREALAVLERSAARWMVTALEHHAVLGGLRGDCDRAAILIGFTDARYAGNDVRQTTERMGYERLMRLLAETFEEEELAEKMRAGSALTQEQALEHAVAINASTQTSPAATAEKRE